MGEDLWGRVALHFFLGGGKLFLPHVVVFRGILPHVRKDFGDGYSYAFRGEDKLYMWGRIYREG